MSYAIICDARSGHDLGIEYLVLVDRKKTKDCWWTSDSPNLILEYKSKRAAEYACRRLRKNNPRVVSASYAESLLFEQQECIDDNEAMASIEAGWDGHKNWL